MVEMKSQLKRQTDSEGLDGLHQEMELVKHQLAEVKAERDAFGSQIA